MKLLRGYPYLYYKLYRFYQTSTYSGWWSDWKALTTIVAMEIWTLFSSAFYYQAVTRKSANDLTWFKMSIWISSAILIIWNWYLFEYKDKWKNIVADFDKLPKKQNKIGSIIILAVVLILIANLIFSIYLLS